jgi:superfamily II DNA or RNA helicase
MLKLSNRYISGGCSSHAVYIRGLNYFQNGAVKELLYDEDSGCFQALVDGSERYLTRVFLGKEGGVDEVDCTCFAFYNYPGYCKHITAVLLTIANRNQQTVKTTEEALVEKLLATYAQTASGEERNKELRLSITVKLRKPYFSSGEPHRLVSLKIGETKTYVVKDIGKLFEAMLSNRPLYFGQHFTYNPAAHSFPPGDAGVIDFIMQIYEFDRQANRSNFRGALKGKELGLNSELFRRLLESLKGSSFDLQIENQLYRGISIIEAAPPLSFKLAGSGDGLQLSLENGPAVTPLTAEKDFVFMEGRIYHLPRPQHQALLPLLDVFETRKSSTLQVRPNQVERFISGVLPSLEQAAPLTMAPAVQKRLYQPPLEAKVYLDYHEGSVIARLNFDYGELTINPFADAAPQERSGSRILVRKTAQEQQVLRLFEQADFKLKGRLMHLDDDEGIWRFIHEYLGQLQRQAAVYYSDSFKLAGARPAPRFSARVGIDRQSDLLELELELEGIEREEIDRIWLSIREKRKYHRLRDGSIIPLQGEGVEQVTRLSDALDLQPADLCQGRVSLPKRQALLLDQLHSELTGPTITQHRDVEALVRLVRHPEEAGHRLPPELNEVLRDYQKTGFQWLKSLAGCGFGGILADDMGLGKTVQAIALILSQRQENPGTLPPALVVAPASLIYNWEAEFAKFAPQLQILVVAGTKAERRELLSRVNPADVIITSYPLLRRDSAEYAGVKFSCLFFDEAQYIKNPQSQTAQCARKLEAKHRFALTGTPMENSLTELWSIFQAIMPGHLQSYRKFIQKYGAPIGSEDPRAREEAATALAARVRPFILRRLKEDVLTELPPKIEHRFISELTKEQKKLYLAYLERLRGEALHGLQEQGFQHNRIKILAGLTRLRQICCHPALFVENYRGESAKLLQLQELLREAVAGGHRILLFSQFTEMLQLIRRLLEGERYNYLYLDGSVKAAERLQLVNAFNSGTAEIFLISLKAGGTGLNLTGADIVIQYDLWWNPAVEEQAAGRAHRIGQDKVVQVFRLLAKDTIEEKIYELQQKKKEMIDRVIQPGETFLAAMSEADIRHILELQP